MNYPLLSEYRSAVMQAADSFERTAVRDRHRTAAAGVDGIRAATGSAMTPKR